MVVRQDVVIMAFMGHYGSSFSIFVVFENIWARNSSIRLPKGSTV